jgi:hypothetical protein
MGIVKNGKCASLSPADSGGGAGGPSEMLTRYRHPIRIAASNATQA